MKTDKLTTTLILAAMMTMGLVVGLNLRGGGTPAYAQVGGGGNFVVEEISSDDEDDDNWKYNGRTLAVVTPGGQLKLVHITWKRQRGDDQDFPKHFAASGDTYNIRVLDAAASLAE